MRSFFLVRDSDEVGIFDGAIGATENGAALLRACIAARHYLLPNACAVNGKTAVQPLRLTRLSPALLAEGFNLHHVFCLTVLGNLRHEDG